MRLGVVWHACDAAYYRAIEPMMVMQGRGHEVVWPPDGSGGADLQRLVGCDVIHVYRRHDAQTRQVVALLARNGAKVTWDDDVGLATVQDAPAARKQRGSARVQRAVADVRRMAGLAGGLSTPSEAVAEAYRNVGAKRVRVIPNQVGLGRCRARRFHGGVVIGWVASPEHRADAEALGIRDALRELMARHPDVRVECIGVDLGLDERYEHDAHVEYHELPSRIAGFDIGIAPLADTPANRAKSDIRIKEYAASEVPWLASSVGPYLPYGEDQGGRLVAEGEWLDALEQLVKRQRQRHKLARRGRDWARTEVIDVASGELWERFFGESQY